MGSEKSINSFEIKNDRSPDYLPDNYYFGNLLRGSSHVKAVFFRSFLRFFFDEL